MAAPGNTLTTPPGEAIQSPRSFGVMPVPIPAWLRSIAWDVQRLSGGVPRSSGWRDMEEG